MKKARFICEDGSYRVKKNERRMYIREAYGTKKAIQGSPDYLPDLLSLIALSNLYIRARYRIARVRGILFKSAIGTDRVNWFLASLFKFADNLSHASPRLERLQLSDYVISQAERRATFRFERDSFFYNRRT